jgi:vacuolar-type H+-ATPase subunit D/Vma8
MTRLEQQIAYLKQTRESLHDKRERLVGEQHQMRKQILDVEHEIELVHEAIESLSRLAGLEK